MDAYRPLPFTLANPATPTGLKIAPVPYAGKCMLITPWTSA